MGRQVNNSVDRASVTDLSDSEIDTLVAAAKSARSMAYAPYSGFAVGAALKTADGTMYTGCNMENASFGLTICAERNAIAHAIAEGAREFKAIAVVTENGVTPCGACRQVLTEFAPELIVIVADMAGKRCIYRLDELFPDAFKPGHLRW